MTAGNSSETVRRGREDARSDGAGTDEGSSRRGRPLRLAVDLGGTKALLGLFAAGATPGAAGRALHQLRLRCAEFDDFDRLLVAYLDQAVAAGAIHAASDVEAACVALAGPVDGARARLTNLPWEVNAARVSALLGGASVRLVNDFVAAAAGIEVLPPGGFRELQPQPADLAAPRLVVGAGTGLGTALVVPSAAGWQVLPGEGGHAGFAPRSDTEIELLRWLARQEGDAGASGAGATRRVSWEDVVSGGGIERIYRFLARERTGTGSMPARWPDASEVADSAFAGARAADPALAQAALDQFAASYGAFAGDAALLTLPRGGVYVAGGIAAKVFDARRTGLFLAAFADKGPHGRLLRALPVRLVLEPAVGLLGSALLAQRDREAPCRLS